MYKLLLCARYLRTRYLALVCVISVMLGVATLIVVNSVMAGFATKLRDRLHGLLADVSVECRDFGGFEDYDGLMHRIKQSPAGPHVEAMTPAIETFAMMQFNFAGTIITKNIRLVGVDPVTRSAVGGFGEYLFDRQGQRIAPSFELDERANYRLNAFRMPADPAVPVIPPMEGSVPAPDAWVHEPKKIQGIYVGQAIASFRDKHEKDPEKVVDIYTMEPGDVVTITCAGGGTKLMPVFDRVAVAGYFKSEMNEYDSNCVYLPLEHIQRLRGMQGRASCLQIKLTDFKHAKLVTEELKKIFPDYQFAVLTWEDKQGPLLSAIDIERGILNVLLFMIVGVAGFGILAIFSMIVVEKTRDIGIMKALGASNRGVLGIFLGYGLLLGFIGAAMGTITGLGITHYLNEVEWALSKVTGTQVFNRRVYYFDSIPTHIEPLTVLFVNLGSLAIAVLFSVLPAMRAAMLTPVSALRYE